MAQNLPQPPGQYDLRWITALWKKVTDAAGFSWSQIDKKGSNLTDIETRNHADLQNLNTANYSHLTADQVTQLTSGGITALHQHSVIGSSNPALMALMDDNSVDDYIYTPNASINAGYVGQTSDLHIAIQNIDDSQRAQLDCGFYSWAAAGPYYSIAANQLTLLVGGTGYIQGRKVTWNGSQTAAAFTAYSSHWLYIDINGILQITTTRTDAMYQNSIPLFSVYYDGVNYEVLSENHPVSFDTDSQLYIHNNIGSVVSPVAGTNVVGANITQITTGTGGAITDRELKMVGAAVMSDHGQSFSIPDSAGAAITWSFYYTNALGNWVEQGMSAQMPMVWNSAGTITALSTGASNDVAVIRLYAGKAEPNSGTVFYYGVIDTAAYNQPTQAANAITTGAVASMTGNLFNAIEPAQLGFVVIQNNGAGGFIHDVYIEKDTLRAQTSSGASNSAALVTTNTVNFHGNLSAKDTTVQIALETLDIRSRYVIPGEDGISGEDGMIIQIQNPAIQTTIQSSIAPIPGENGEDGDSGYILLQPQTSGSAIIGSRYLSFAARH